MVKVQIQITNPEDATSRVRVTFTPLEGGDSSITELAPHSSGYLQLAGAGTIEVVEIPLEVTDVS